MEGQAAGGVERRHARFPAVCVTGKLHCRRLCCITQEDRNGKDGSQPRGSGVFAYADLTHKREMEAFLTGSRATIDAGCRGASGSYRSHVG